MTTSRMSLHGQWSSRLAFILAATGSAVGLGNIWKFPYIAGENGGGAFVLVYLVCIAVIGIPVMMAEIMLGRRGRQSPINTMRTLAMDERASGLWRYMGWLGVVAGFLILSYYSVIAGWALSYIFKTAQGTFTGASTQFVTAQFSSLLSSPVRLVAWHSIFMFMTMVVVARGVQSGLEQAVRYLMPALGVILLTLVGYAVIEGDFMQGVHFLFDPDFSKLNGNAILIAMGHAFFTLSLGMGAMMAYGSYLSAHTSIAKTTFIVAAADTAVALLAGLAIFPLVFAEGLQPDAGPGLIFKTLPIAFGSMPGGEEIGTLFFVLLVFAAWTSAISIIEPVVSYLVEQRGVHRGRAALWSGLAAWVVGLGTVFSFNIGSGVTVLGKTFFDLADYLTSNIMLPLGGFLIAVFAAWIMREQSSIDEFDMGDRFAYRLWFYIVRYFSPLGILIIFLHAIGLL
ncbi:MAG: sodium-dependent transporter [Gammaproteobacteria bacterium]|jgi:NSS family neurotransmitter:Na+ symporter